MKTGKGEPGLSMTKHYVVDSFHAHGHSNECPCNPRVKRSLKAKIADNTSVGEQVFAWFRRYTPIMNEMRENRHKFMLLCLCRRHNMAVASKQTAYLRPLPMPKQTKKLSKTYQCSKKPAAKKQKSKPTKKTTSSKKIVQRKNKPVKKHAMKSCQPMK